MERAQDSRMFDVMVGIALAGAGALLLIGAVGYRKVTPEEAVRDYIADLDLRGSVSCEAGRSIGANTPCTAFVTREEDTGQPPEVYALTLQCNWHGSCQLSEVK